MPRAYIPTPPRTCEFCGSPFERPPRVGIGLGVELKPSYYRQAVKNLRSIGDEAQEQSLLGLMGDGPALSVVDGLGNAEEASA